MMLEATTKKRAAAMQGMLPVGQRTKSLPPNLMSSQRSQRAPAGLFPFLPCNLLAEAPLEDFLGCLFSVMKS